MSPVVVCMGALDAVVLAQAAYAAKELGLVGSKADDEDSKGESDSAQR